MDYLASHGEAHIGDIYDGVTEALGEQVPKSSIRSYLNLNTSTKFVRTRRGRYRLRP